MPIDFYSNRTKLMFAVSALGFVATTAVLFIARLSSYQWIVVGLLHHCMLFAHYEVGPGRSALCLTLAPAFRSSPATSAASASG